MSIYKRQGVYWFNFWHENEHYQRSTRQTNQRIARRMEAAFRTRLMQEGVGIVQRKPSPVFADFAKRFIEHVQVRHESKPQTVSFYAAKLNRLMA